MPTVQQRGRGIISIERGLYREGLHIVYREMALYLQREASYSLQRDGFIFIVRGFMQSIERWLYIYRERLHTIYSGGFISTVCIRRGFMLSIEVALHLQGGASYFLQRYGLLFIERGCLQALERWLYIYREWLHTVHRDGFISIGRGFILSTCKEMALYLWGGTSYCLQRWLYIKREGLHTVYRDGFISIGKRLQTVYMYCIYGFILRGRCFILCL